MIHVIKENDSESFAHTLSQMSESWAAAGLVVSHVSHSVALIPMGAAIYSAVVVVEHVVAE